jgi:hypothetical protein
MMLLADMHDAQFGAAEPKGGTGFSEAVIGTGWEALR